MELTREHVFINTYHYDARNLEWEKEHGAPETGAEVTFQLVNKDEAQLMTSFVAVLQFMIVKDEFVVSGIISQINHLHGRIVNGPSEFSQEEVEHISAPLLAMLKRMTYEVTEIALDRPGVSLEI